MYKPTYIKRLCISAYINLAYILRKSKIYLGYIGGMQSKKCCMGIFVRWICVIYRINMRYNKKEQEYVIKHMINVGYIYDKYVINMRYIHSTTLYVSKSCVRYRINMCGLWAKICDKYIYLLKF